MTIAMSSEVINLPTTKPDHQYMVQIWIAYLPVNHDVLRKREWICNRWGCPSPRFTRLCGAKNMSYTSSLKPRCDR